MHADELIYDWNEVGRRHKPFGTVEFFDETLRDGLQNPSVKDPTIEEKLELLHLMDSLGIHAADIGLPGSNKRAYDDVLRMCQEIDRCKLKIRPAAAGRTVVADILPMIEITQKTGIPLEVYTFIGSSPIRLFAEDWTVERLVKNSAEAIDVAVKKAPISACAGRMQLCASAASAVAAAAVAAIVGVGPAATASAESECSGKRGQRPPG